MMAPLRNLRLTLLECFVKICRMLARLNFTLPEPVNLKRFLAPLCVFILGMVFPSDDSPEGDG